MSEDTNEVMRLKKRIWKSKDKASSYFAQKEIRAKKLKQIAAVRQKAAIDSKIVMYRKYRVGELPDIQIKHSELIVPLQAAAQCDSVIARDLFKVGTYFASEKFNQIVGFSYWAFVDRSVLRSS